jgi:hypothetical protein
MTPTTSESGAKPLTSDRLRGATETSYERRISTVELCTIVSRAEGFRSVRGAIDDEACGPFGTFSDSEGCVPSAVLTGFDS